jgi:hypothetical protein
MDRIDRGEHVQRADDPLSYQDRSPEEKQRLRARIEQDLAQPIEQSGLYQAGQRAEDYADKTFPLRPDQRASRRGQFLGFIGGAGPALLATGIGALVGVPEIGLMAGATQMALQSGGAEFERALAAGADEDTAAKAAHWSAGIGLALGTVPLAAVLRPLRQAAPGWLSYAAAKLQQAGLAGASFTGAGEAQQWLGQQIAREYYDPNAEYSPDVKRVLASFIGGAAIGFAHPTAGARAPAAGGQTGVRAPAAEGFARTQAGRSLAPARETSLLQTSSPKEPGGEAELAVSEPTSELSGPVIFSIPDWATPVEVDQFTAYVKGANEAGAAGALSSIGRVPTKGALRDEASQAARAERARAEAAGTPYQGHAGHVPDTTWTGNPNPHSWMDLSGRVNSSLGAQALRYPVGHKAQIFLLKRKTDVGKRD